MIGLPQKYRNKHIIHGFSVFSLEAQLQDDDADGVSVWFNLIVSSASVFWYVMFNYLLAMLTMMFSRAHNYIIIIIIYVET